MFSNNGTHHRTRHPQTRRGVTLFEVLCAISVLLVAMLGISLLLSNAVRSATHARHRTIAALIGTSKLAAVATGAEPQTSMGRWLRCDDAFPAWRYRWTIEPTAWPHLRQITVTVAKQTTDDASAFDAKFTQLVAPATPHTTPQHPDRDAHLAGGEKQ